MRLLTVGHSTASAEGFRRLLAGAGVRRVVDVRTAPGSRRHPQFARDALTAWLPEAGIAYQWEGRDLGGWRKALPGSPNVALEHPSFRGYADHMRTPAFLAALDRVLALAAREPTAVMCAERLWWRCHRRLLADAAVLLRGAEVLHLDHDGSLVPHRPSPEARREGGVLVYDAGHGPRLPGT